VVERTAPGPVPLANILPSIRQSMAQTWLAGWKAPPSPAPDGELTARCLVMRNARQDRALAESSTPPAPPKGADPEWPLDWRRRLLHSPLSVDTR